jgi:hypothetical protein
VKQTRPGTARDTPKTSRYITLAFCLRAKGKGEIKLNSWPSAIVVVTMTTTGDAVMLFPGYGNYCTLSTIKLRTYLFDVCPLLCPS